MAIGYPVLPLPAGCPWSTFDLPTIKYCEENLCSWVVAPSNTWSNLSYFVVGVWLWRKLARERAGLPTLFAPAAIGTGLGSFAYHASYTYFFQIFDFLGMYMFAGLLIALNLHRVGWITRKLVIPAYLFFIVAGTLPFVLTHGEAGKSLFAFQILGALALEVVLYLRSRKSGPRIDYRAFGSTFAFFALAYSAWWIDTGSVWCIPSNHILQGHAVWHLTNAVCFATMAKFYRQFPGLSAARP
jgi:hypothetical protein